MLFYTNPIVWAMVAPIRSWELELVPLPVHSNVKHEEKQRLGCESNPVLFVRKWAACQRQGP